MDSFMGEVALQNKPPSLPQHAGVYLCFLRLDEYRCDTIK